MSKAGDPTILWVVGKPTQGPWRSELTRSIDGSSSKQTIKAVDVLEITQSATQAFLVRRRARLIGLLKKKTRTNNHSSYISCFLFPSKAAPSSHSRFATHGKRRDSLQIRGIRAKRLTSLARRYGWDDGACFEVLDGWYYGGDEEEMCR